MKKIFIALVALFLLSGVAFGANLNDASVAELVADPQGRAVIFDETQVVNIWYTGTARTVGVGVSNSTIINFVEDGVYTGAAFEGAYDSVDTNVATADTVAELVSIINSDTNGNWHASQGRDVTPNTTTYFLVTQNFQAPGNNEAGSVKAVNDTSTSHIMLAGFAADGHATLRLKQLEETAQGTGVHTIEVWDGSTSVYKRVYPSATIYSGSGSPAAGGLVGVTPLTVAFPGVGICAKGGKGLSVSSGWSTTMAGDSASTENLSIIVDKVKR